MGKVIHKFQLPYGPSRTTIIIPKNPRILKVDEQDGLLMLWAIIDEESKMGEIDIQVIPTGQTIGELEENELRHHLNTVITESGLVWHVFQILKISTDA